MLVCHGSKQGTITSSKQHLGGLLLCLLLLLLLLLLELQLLLLVLVLQLELLELLELSRGVARLCCLHM